MLAAAKDISRLIAAGALLRDQHIEVEVDADFVLLEKTGQRPARLIVRTSWSSVKCSSEGAAGWPLPFAP